MIPYTVWKCNSGSLWLFTREGEQPPVSASGVPVRDPENAGRFEAEDDAIAPARFADKLGSLLPRPVEPSAEECRAIIRDRGLPQQSHDHLSGIASGDVLRVCGAVNRLGKLRQFRDSVVSVLDWAPSGHLRSVVKNVLATWPERDTQ
jgi:hypothetical protein